VKIAILYEDDEIMVQMTPEEFVDEMSKYFEGDVKSVIDKIIDKLKKKTLRV